MNYGDEMDEARRIKSMPNIELAATNYLEAQAHLFDLINDPQELKRWMYVLEKRQYPTSEELENV